MHGLYIGVGIRVWIDLGKKGKEVKEKL